MRAFTVIGDFSAEVKYGDQPWHKPDVLAFNEKAMDSVGWREKLFAHPSKVVVAIATGTTRPEVSDGAKMFKFYENKEKFTEILTKWQQANGIKSDGKIGNETWTAIKAVLSGKKPAKSGGGGSKPSTSKPSTSDPASDPALDPTLEPPVEKDKWWAKYTTPTYLIVGGTTLLVVVGLFLFPSSKPRDQRKSGRLDGYSDEPANVRKLRQAGYLIPERNGSYTLMPPGKRPYNLSHDAALALVARKPDPERW